MQVEKGKTAKYLKEKRKVPASVLEHLKEFTKTKKAILKALKESEMNIPELAKKLDMPTSDVTYYVMTLHKYGFIGVGAIDDMDEYFTYKVTE